MNFSKLVIIFAAVVSCCSADNLTSAAASTTVTLEVPQQLQYGVLLSGPLEAPKQILTIYSSGEPPEVIRKQNSLYSNLGVVGGLRHCGGSGKVIQWRSEACNSYIGETCLIPVNQFHRWEVTFVPSESADKVGVRTNLKISLSPGQPPQELKWEFPSASKEAVEAGKEYVVTSSGTVVPELRGKMFTARAEVFREIDNRIEACAEADFQLV